MLLARVNPIVSRTATMDSTTRVAFGFIIQEMLLKVYMTDEKLSGNSAAADGCPVHGAPR